MSINTRVLLAEDDADLRSAMADVLQDNGIDVVAVADGAGARSYMDDCVLLDIPRPRVHALVPDLSMPGMSGPGLLDYLDSLGHALPTVVVTGLDTETVARVSELPSVLAVLHKPFELDELLIALRRALEGESGGAS